MRRALVPAVLLALAGCSGGSSAPLPSSDIDGVKTFAGLSHDHFTKGSDYPHTYTPVPPVGGAHSKAWLRCAVYTEQVPDENAVHSLEHGSVWITYQPALAAADVATVAALSGIRPDYVLVSPYPGLTSPVVVSAWGLQLALPSASDPRLAEFVRTYAGNGLGGEQGAPCRDNGLSVADAKAFDAQPTQ